MFWELKVYKSGREKQDKEEIPGSEQSMYGYSDLLQASTGEH